MNFLASVVVLLASTALFCLLFTADWGLGPVCHLAFFAGGILAVSLAGVASLRIFNLQR